MLVLDTNIWVYAFTGKNATAMRLVERAVSGNAKTVVDTYLYWEVINALGNSKGLSRPEITEAQDQFGQFVWGSTPSIRNEVDEDLISTYRDAATLEEGIETIRSRRHNQLLGEICDIQPKDAPIVALAFEFREEAPTIYTNDSELAEWVPDDCNLPAITVEYVSTEQRQPEPNLYSQHLR